MITRVVVETDGRLWGEVRLNADNFYAVWILDKFANPIADVYTEKHDTLREGVEDLMEEIWSRD